MDRLDWFTNACIDKGTEAAIHQLQQFPELLGPKSPVFFLPGLRSQKQIRDASGFSGINPSILNLVQGVYEKSEWFVLYILVAIFSIPNVSRILIYEFLIIIWQSFPFTLNFCLPFFIDFLAFYRQSSHVFWVLFMPLIFGWWRTFMGFQPPNRG